jgi:hypothetical protein
VYDTVLTEKEKCYLGYDYRNTYPDDYLKDLDTREREYKALQLHAQQQLHAHSVSSNSSSSSSMSGAFHEIQEDDDDDNEEQRESDSNEVTARTASELRRDPRAVTSETIGGYTAAEIDKLWKDCSKRVGDEVPYDKSVFTAMISRIDQRFKAAFAAIQKGNEPLLASSTPSRNEVEMELDIGAVHRPVRRRMLLTKRKQAANTDSDSGGSDTDDMCQLTTTVSKRRRVQIPVRRTALYQ